MHKIAKIYNFSRSLFWDVNIDSLDIEVHSRFIVERVVSRGNMQDWDLLKKMYGKRKIKDEVLQIRYLDKKTISFLSVYFNTEKSNFRCCN